VCVIAVNVPSVQQVDTEDNPGQIRIVSGLEGSGSLLFVVFQSFLETGYLAM